MVRGKYVLRHLGTKTKIAKARAESGTKTAAAWTVSGWSGKPPIVSKKFSIPSG